MGVGVDVDVGVGVDVDVDVDGSAKWDKFCRSHFLNSLITILR